MLGALLVAITTAILFVNKGRQHICGRQDNTPSPKDVCILIPRTCEYGTLHGKEDFPDAIKSQILRWED